MKAKLQIIPGVALLPPSQTPSCFWNESNLFAIILFCLDSAHYAEIFSQSLTRFFVLMIGLDLNICIHEKQVKMRTK